MRRKFQRALRSPPAPLRRPFGSGLISNDGLQGALRSFRNLNRRKLRLLVSVDAFAAALCATGA